jgi:hypothetical protein
MGKGKYDNCSNTNNIRELDKTDFMRDKFDAYGYRQWLEYRKLSISQKICIENLRSWHGKLVEFKYRNKTNIMRVEAVILHPNETIGDYGAYPYQFRLNWTDGKKRQHQGFWTNKIDNLKLIKDTN